LQIFEKESPHGQCNCKANIKSLPKKKTWGERSGKHGGDVGHGEKGLTRRGVEGVQREQHKKSRKSWSASADAKKGRKKTT